jgi:hypothetical protein
MDERMDSSRENYNFSTAETAHTWYTVVTDAVFQAPMSALNADAW